MLFIVGDGLTLDDFLLKDEHLTAKGNTGIRSQQLSSISRNINVFH